MRKPNWIYIIPKHRKLRTTSRFLAVVPSEAFFILRRPPQGLLLQTPSLREPRLLRRVSRCSLFQTCGKSGSWSISTPLTYNILMPVWRSKRSEERRVGKECRARWARQQGKRQKAEQARYARHAG